ncbi:MAG: cobalamin biosynthesis protein CobD [Deltaproteobacteria bacterium]|nr:cobalamin biosynthesis protein CobD [Deltaproteobacteria bacterium]
MDYTLVLILAFALDAVIGDPHWLPHPVRLIGKAITYWENRIRRTAKASTSDFQRGATLVTIIVLWTYLLTALGLHFLTLWSWWVGTAVTILLGSLCLARRNLKEHAQAVLAPLANGDMAAARAMLARIVSRETSALSATEVIRGTVESVAENSSDGVIAPLFYMSIGGVPLAMAYKAVNTLDSMIGYRTEQYEQFGKVAARLDDVANYIPARLTALALIGAAWIGRQRGHRYDEKEAWRITWRDGHKHDSPNAGYPEAAMAGALGIQLGGPSRYSGEVHDKPTLGDARHTLHPEHITQSCELLDVASLLMLALCVILAVL